MDRESLYQAIQVRRDIVRGLWEYLSPAILVVGALTNSLTVILMWRKRITQYSFLIALAISDFIHLHISLMTFWLSQTFGIFIDATEITCKLFGWVTHTAKSYSTWLLVLIAVDGLLFSLYPYLLKSRSKVSNILRLLVPLFVLMALNGHSLYGNRLISLATVNNITHRACKIVDDRRYRSFLFTIFPLIDSFFMNLLPFVILLISSIIIVLKVKTVMRNVREEQKTVSVKLILAMNTVFLLTKMPFSVYSFIYKYMRLIVGEDPLQPYNIGIITVIIYMLSYINNCVNFFLYLIFDPLLRQELFSVFLKKRQ